MFTIYTNAVGKDNPTIIQSNVSTSMSSFQQNDNKENFFFSFSRKMKRKYYFTENEGQDKEENFTVINKIFVYDP